MNWPDGYGFAGSPPRAPTRGAPTVRLVSVRTPVRIYEAGCCRAVGGGQAPALHFSLWALDGVRDMLA